MTNDDCTHTWGEAEECETGYGLVRTPVCTQCGAIKHQVDLVARRKLEASWIESPRPRVHTHQAQIFPDV